MAKKRGMVLGFFGGPGQSQVEEYVGGLDNVEEKPDMDSLCKIWSEGRSWSPTEQDAVKLIGSQRDADTRVFVSAPSDYDFYDDLPPQLTIRYTYRGRERTKQMNASEFGQKLGL